MLIFSFGNIFPLDKALISAYKQYCGGRVSPAPHPRRAWLDSQGNHHPFAGVECLCGWGGSNPHGTYVPLASRASTSTVSSHPRHYDIGALIYSGRRLFHPQSCFQAVKNSSAGLWTTPLILSFSFLTRYSILISSLLQFLTRPLQTPAKAKLFLRLMAFTISLIITPSGFCRRSCRYFSCDDPATSFSSCFKDTENPASFAISGPRSGASVYALIGDVFVRPSPLTTWTSWSAEAQYINTVPSGLISIRCSMPRI